MFDFRLPMLGLNLPDLSLPSFGINSVLDILLISFVIYQIMMWIKQTRAWTLFKGAVVIIIVYCVSLIFRLDTTAWLISSFAYYAIVIFAVIFQPELRKALEKIGKGKLINWVGASEASNVFLTAQSVDEIIKAIQFLSKNKTGALIVIEQAVALGDLESTGIKIDAVVSSQLIINIFVDKTPLHDGAVLIRDNRVSAASCILPLTGVQLSSELGTRHRAAVGASEVSDAYVLVVSEETGAISIAKEGKLSRHIAPDKIKDLLSETIKPKKNGKMVFRKGRRGVD